MEHLRSAIRPLVTVAMVGAFLVYAHYDGSAFDRIKDTALMVTAYWFGSRSK